MNNNVNISDRGSKSLIRFVISELKPRGKIFTPFNIISGLIILLSLVILVIRFAKGLGSVADASQLHPWGLWISFNVITGVAFAGGAYVLTFMVYILNMKKYHSIVRMTVLWGFLAYSFYAGALILDLGRPWNIINPIIGNSFGLSSVLFLVAWHFILYIIAQFIEFSPAIAEWLEAKRLRKILVSLTIGTVIFGITLSVLHQSGLGALFMMAKAKIHPLWYSEFLPILFLISSIFAGLSIIIVVGSICQKVFKNQLKSDYGDSYKNIVFGFAKICAVAMFVYLFLRLLVLIHSQQWALINTHIGYWFLLEILGFVLVPFIFFIYGFKHRSMLLIHIASIMTIIGIILNRLNVSMIAYLWNDPLAHYPTWMEIVVSVSVILAQIWIFRWIIYRMPILRKSPDWVPEDEEK